MMHIEDITNTSMMDLEDITNTSMMDLEDDIEDVSEGTNDDSSLVSEGTNESSLVSEGSVSSERATVIEDDSSLIELFGGSSSTIDIFSLIRRTNLARDCN